MSFPDEVPTKETPEKAKPKAEPPPPSIVPKVPPREVYPPGYEIC